MGSVSGCVSVLLSLGLGTLRSPPPAKRVFLKALGAGGGAVLACLPGQLQLRG